MMKYKLSRDKLVVWRQESRRHSKGTGSGSDSVESLLEIPSRVVNLSSINHETRVPNYVSQTERWTFHGVGALF